MQYSLYVAIVNNRMNYCCNIWLCAFAAAGASPAFMPERSNTALTYCN